MTDAPADPDPIMNAILRQEWRTVPNISAFLAAEGKGRLTIHPERPPSSIIVTDHPDGSGGYVGVAGDLSPCIAEHIVNLHNASRQTTASG